MRDDKVAKISKMIETENDPNIRATLLTLQCIAEEVVDQSKIIKTHDDLLINHEKIVNTALTLWSVGVWIAGILQVIILAMGGYVFNDLQNLNKSVIQLHYTVDAMRDGK